MFTPYHATYYAHELTRKSASDDPNKLGASIINATVDLNPHQVEAALFAFKSPLSRGAILADEVGLGKTIEAGLLISQLWAERKRRILVVCPTILRKQWAQELKDKFYLDSLVLDSKVWSAQIKQGNRPLLQKDQVVICSYNFIQSKESEFISVPWDLVVIDEAHRLRNVWKSGNKIASAIQRAVANRPIALLTATPLQNTLLELYGLVSFVDEHIFGDIDAFKARYMRGPLDQRDLKDLKQRLEPICQRTLRRQVEEYVKFTARIPITGDFTPTEDEHRLYQLVSEYLQRDDIEALPPSQRKLMTLVLRKLLASSTFAISQTLGRMIERIKDKNPDITGSLEDDFETLDEIAEELDVDDPNAQPPELTDEQRIIREVRELAEYQKLAESITVNAKGQRLLQVLEEGFNKLEELEANRKAVIFTESRRTQQYLLSLLNENGYEGRVLTINGTNSDDKSGQIYKDWIARHKGESVVTGHKAVDLRAALVEHFKDYADILIATEAAAEGVNLQFCSLVVNYDLPWNPQRIEQRIGRCHRYGQQFDVVVVNFINRSNEADVRVFELLDEKFNLFKGVFGSSDEVLGVLESGVDFEQRVLEIYQTCRTSEQIDQAFNSLREELDDQIQARMKQVHKDVLANLDEDVRKKLRLRREQTEAQVGELEELLYRLAQSELDGLAKFNDELYEFELLEVPEWAPNAEIGKYVMVTRKGKEHAQTFRLGHPLTEAMLVRAKERVVPPIEATFVYDPSKGRRVDVEEHLGKSGYLMLSKLTVESEIDQEEKLVFTVLDNQLKPVHWKVGRALMNLPMSNSKESLVSPDVEDALKVQAEQVQVQILGELEDRKSRFFSDEIEKLERWADDLKHGLEVEIKDLRAKVNELKKTFRLTQALQQKLEIQKELREIEKLRDRKQLELYKAQDDIDGKKEELIDRVEAQLKQSISSSSCMFLNWLLETK